MRTSMGAPGTLTCSAAAHESHLECLRYAHEHGCPWDEWTCYCAAYGHLECLRYAHQHGCPWDEKTLSCCTQRPPGVLALRT